MQDTRCKMQDARCKMQDARCKVAVEECFTLYWSDTALASLTSIDIWHCTWYWRFDGCDRRKGERQTFRKWAPETLNMARDKTALWGTHWSPSGTQRIKRTPQHLDSSSSSASVHAKQSNRQLLKETENEAAQSLLDVSKNTFSPGHAKMDSNFE